MAKGGRTIYKIIAPVLILIFFIYTLLDHSSAIEAPPLNNSLGEIHDVQCSKKVLLIPLDSRPVNTTNVSLLGGIAGIQVIYPQKGLDFYTNPCDFPVIEDFLIDHIQSVDGVIIGIPEWLNGGMIEARNAQSYVKNQYRIERLKEILSKYPEKKVYLINLIPREIPSYTLNSFQYRKEIMTFGKQYDEFCISELNNRDMLWGRIKGIENTGTTPYINDYINLFEENYKVTKELMDWVQTGIADELIIGMDDTSVTGMAKFTERRIRNDINEDPIQNVTLMTGADELSSLILARYKNELTKQGSNYSITYSCSADKNKIYPYDGRSIAQVVKEKTKFVQPFNSKHDLPIKIYIHSSEEPISDLVQWTETQENEMKGVANLAFAYTSITWMEDFFHHHLNERIESFSGWNTAANTLGLLIAHLEMIKDIPTWNGHHEQWVYLRYIEDYYYNLKKRKEYSSTYSPFYMLNPMKEKELTSSMCNESNELLDNLSIVTRQNGKTYCIPSQYDVAYIDFPWNRIYEISCNFERN